MTIEINLTPTASQFTLGQTGRQITGRTWGTASECRAAALLVHGLGSHSGWFEAFARQLKVKRVFALAYDQLGFGKRSNQTLISYQQWLDDLQRVYGYLKEQIGDKPIFLMGNSMGAAIAFAAIESICPEGLVLFSPGFDGYPGTFTLPFRIRSIIQAFFKPQSYIELPYPIELITREENARKWIASDPERKDKIPAGMAMELLKLTLNLKAKTLSAPCPVLMITAGVDKVVNNKANAEFFSKLCSPSKSKQHFQESWHDLMFDPEIDRVTDAVLTWISQCAPEQMLAH